MVERDFILIVQESAYPQMGALYLASVLARHGIRTNVVSCAATTKDLDILISRVDPIAVGCSVMTAPEILDFVRLSAHVQETYNQRKTEIPVIWGGMHSTIVSSQTVRESYINVVVSGEAEITLPKILTDILGSGKLPGKLVVAQTPPHLDEYVPAWDTVEVSRFLFPESHSVHAGSSFERQHIFYYLLTSRGCTYKCNFCWEVARTAAMRAEMGSNGAVDLTWRAHSVQWVRAQLEYLHARLAKQDISIDGVGMWDDMIFGRSRPEHIERARLIFSMMSERGYGYLLEARANQLVASSNRWNGTGKEREADLYHFLRETGCMQVFVGTESGSQATLNMIQKGTRVRDYARLVEISRLVGLPLRFSMIVGFPEESDASVNETLDLIEALEHEPYVSVSGPKLFTPYPGTPQYIAAVKAGMKPPETTVEWARLNRYSDFRSLFPWLTRNCREKTLERIDHCFSKVSVTKRHQASEQAILELVRTH